MINRVLSSDKPFNDQYPTTATPSSGIVNIIRLETCCTVVGANRSLCLRVARKLTRRLYMTNTQAVVTTTILARNSSKRLMLYLSVALPSAGRTLTSRRNSQVGVRNVGKHLIRSASITTMMTQRIRKPDDVFKYFVFYCKRLSIFIESDLRWLSWIFVFTHFPNSCCHVYYADMKLLVFIQPFCLNLILNS